MVSKKKTIARSTVDQGFFFLSPSVVSQMETSSETFEFSPQQWTAFWPSQGEVRPPRVLTTPHRTLGGLPRPTVGRRPRCTTPTFHSSPLSRPPCRPPPRSLCTTSDHIVKPSPLVHEQGPEDGAPKGLVMPTSAPPDICRVSRLCFQTSLQTWSKAKQQYEVWLGQLILEIKSASLIYCEFAHKSTYKVVITQLLAQVGPSTLDFYSKGIETMLVWMQFIEVTWETLSLNALVTILCQAKEAAKHDAQGIRIQPPHLLQSLKWLAKTALMQNLSDLLQGALISNFCKGSGIPKDRREAVPLPFLVLARWEDTIVNPCTPKWIKLLLGGFLMAVWASLRYADLQRVDLQTLNLAPNTLRGLCRVTKTTRIGQPFAIIVAGLTAFSFRSSWVFHWLVELQQAMGRSHPFLPDFTIPVLDSLHEPSMKAPLSYSAGLRALRWAVQTPWCKGNIPPLAARNYTLHSLKVTLLSSAAQLRLPLRARQLQGHHRTSDSAQLYSRDDTVDGLWLQQEISKATRQGWRPVRPMQRGGQTPLQEPTFELPFKTFPDDIDFPQDAHLSRFQSSIEMQMGDEQPSPVMWDITGESDSSDSLSSCSSSSSEKSQQEEGIASTHIQIVIQNGPSGCCHAATLAHVTRDSSMSFSFQDQMWTTCCGAKLKASATVIPLSEARWPCRRAACRKALDKFPSLQGAPSPS